MVSSRTAGLLVGITLALQVMGTQAQDGLRVDSISWTRPAVLALKTNLLADLVLGLNAEVELPLDSARRWSLMSELWSPWYVWHHNSRAYEIQTIGLELRHWLTNDDRRYRLRGAFAGIYAAASRYDLEWNSKGDQGECLSVGLTGGWVARLADNLNLEASLSLGALWGPRSHYEGRQNDTRLVWQYDDHTRYFGPTKLKLSLVWLFCKERKEARR